MSRCLLDTRRLDRQESKGEVKMAVFLVLLGCSLFSGAVGLWIGFLRGYAACIRGQRAWLKLHCAPLKDIDVNG